MRKGLWFLLLALFLFGVPAYAAFDASHHDLRQYSTSPQGCYHCHGRLQTSTVVAAVATGAGQVGTMCLYRCHATGQGIFGTDPGGVQPMGPGYVQVGTNDGTWLTQAADFNIVRFDVAGHGRDLTNAAITNSGPVTVGFPYAAAAQATGNIECTSCHAVHDNANPPFVWRPLIGTTAVAGICDACHSTYADMRDITNAAALPTGNHPVNFAIDNTNTATSGAQQRTSSATPFRTKRNPRRINIDRGATYVTGQAWGIFDVPGAGTTGTDNMSLAATHWNTGGHMIRPADNTFQGYSNNVSVMGCATCHSAHLGNPANGGISNQTVIAYRDVAAATGGYNPICVGCHGSANTWATNKADWNVGMSAYGHPAGSTSVNTGTALNYNTSVGGFTFVVAAPTGVQWGANGQVLCESCHYVHRHTAAGSTGGAVLGSMAIRNYGQAATRVVCKSCHTGVGFPNIANVTAPTPGAGEAIHAHHRTTVGPISVGFGTHARAAQATPALTIANPSWAATAPLGLGDYSSGMDCADCHVFNGTAHNW
jgi:hypothetical protein